MTINSVLCQLPSQAVGTYFDCGIDAALNMINDIDSNFKINNVLEIGVHVGHSSTGFLSVFAGNVVGVDIGGEWISPELLLRVESVLKSCFDNRFKIYVHDSQDHDFLIPELSRTKFDMIHVDGHHTYDYCMRDIDLGKKLGIPYFLVDDFNCEFMQRSVADSKLEILKVYRNIHSGGCDLAFCKS